MRRAPALWFVRLLLGVSIVALATLPRAAPARGGGGGSGGFHAGAVFVGPGGRVATAAWAAGVYRNGAVGFPGRGCAGYLSPFTGSLVPPFHVPLIPPFGAATSVSAIGGPIARPAQVWRLESGMWHEEQGRPAEVWRRGANGVWRQEGAG